MAPHKSDIYSDVKCLIIREIKLSHESFLMDVLCSEQEILFILEDMSHVII